MHAIQKASSSKTNGKSERRLPLKWLPVWALSVGGFVLSGLGLHRVTASEIGSVHTTARYVRGLASLPFPRHGATNDVDDILNDYQDYLKFAAAIGRDVDPSTTQKLLKTYDKLRARDRKGAARFLRGLRFEMVQKLEFMGISQKNVTTQTPAVRSWVRRFLKAWHREADEYLFRAIAYRSRRSE
jgi:hypothetical protein